LLPTHTHSQTYTPPKHTKANANIFITEPKPKVRSANENCADFAAKSMQKVLVQLADL